MSPLQQFHRRFHPLTTWGVFAAVMIVAAGYALGPGRFYEVSGELKLPELRESYGETNYPQAPENHINTIQEVILSKNMSKRVIASMEPEEWARFFEPYGFETMAHGALERHIAENLTVTASRAMIVTVRFRHHDPQVPVYIVSRYLEQSRMYLNQVLSDENQSAVESVRLRLEQLAQSRETARQALRAFVQKQPDRSIEELKLNANYTALLAGEETSKRVENEFRVSSEKFLETNARATGAAVIVREPVGPAASGFMIPYVVKNLLIGGLIGTAAGGVLGLVVGRCTRSEQL